METEQKKNIEMEIENKIKKNLEEIPSIKSDRKKTFVILIISILLAVLMKNVMNLAGWWLVLISLLNVISIISGVLFIIQNTKIFYLNEMEEIIREKNQKK